MQFKFAKTRDVKYPSKGHATDAGTDFFVPEFTTEFLNDLKSKSQNEGLEINENEIVLNHGDSVLIPSGIKVEIPFGYMGCFFNKSGVASKRGLLVGAQVVDTFYSGEVHINLHNSSNKAQKIKPNEKIVQLVLVPVLSAEPVLCEEEALYDWMHDDEKRGDGGFGSTDAKQLLAENQALKAELHAKEAQDSIS